MGARERRHFGEKDEGSVNASLANVPASAKSGAGATRSIPASSTPKRSQHRSRFEPTTDFGVERTTPK